MVNAGIHSASPSPLPRQRFHSRRGPYGGPRARGAARGGRHLRRQLPAWRLQPRGGRQGCAAAHPEWVRRRSPPFPLPHRPATPPDRLPRSPPPGRWADRPDGAARAGGRPRRCVSRGSCLLLERAARWGAPGRPQRQSLPPVDTTRGAPRAAVVTGAAPAGACACRRAWKLKVCACARPHRTTCCAAPWRCMAPKSGKKSVRHPPRRGGPGPAAAGTQASWPPGRCPCRRPGGAAGTPYPPALTPPAANSRIFHSAVRRAVPAPLAEGAESGAGQRPLDGGGAWRDTRSQAADLHIVRGRVPFCRPRVAGAAGRACISSAEPAA